MNAYDFDGTIYDGDSGIDFVMYVFSKKPFFVIGHMIKSIGSVIGYKFGKVDFKTAKSKVFAFVGNVDNLDELIEGFANKNKNKLKDYYHTNRKDDDLIISASLDFYLKPLCEKIGLKNVICTEYDIKSGVILNENCKGEEKVKRFEAIYGKDAIIENAYGDSKGDIPLLKRAKNGYMIKKQKVTKYEF